MRNQVLDPEYPIARGISAVNGRLRFFQRAEFYLRVAGILALFLGIVMTRANAARWLFASHVFNPRLQAPLIVARLGASVLGIFLLAFGGGLGRRWDRFWNGLEPAGKLIGLNMFLVFASISFYGLSRFWEWDVVLGEWVNSYSRHATILGFDIIIQVERFTSIEMMTFLFLALSSWACFTIYGLRRWFAPARAVYDTGADSMWFIFGFGAAYLALDEYLGLQDLIGMNLSSHVPILSSGKVELALFYVLIAAVLFVRFRRYLMGCRSAVGLIIAGLVLAMVGEILDPLVEVEALTELPEALSTIFLFGAILQYGTREVQRIIG